MEELMQVVKEELKQLANNETVEIGAKESAMMLKEAPVHAMHKDWIHIVNKKLMKLVKDEPGRLETMKTEQAAKGVTMKGKPMLAVQGVQIPMKIQKVKQEVPVLRSRRIRIKREKLERQKKYRKTRSRTIYTDDDAVTVRISGGRSDPGIKIRLGLKALKRTQKKCTLSLNFDLN